MSNGDIVFQKREEALMCHKTILDDNMRFVKVREEYTFEEAFKAFEEGKEIKSCVDNCVYSREIEGSFENLISFTPKQIRGKWHINN